MIFTLAAQQGSEIGQADPKVWAEISRELKMIDDIVSSGDENETLDDAPLGEGVQTGLQ